MEVPCFLAPTLGVAAKAMALKHETSLKPSLSVYLKFYGRKIFSNKHAELGTVRFERANDTGKVVAKISHGTATSMHAGL